MSCARSVLLPAVVGRAHNPAAQQVTHQSSFQAPRPRMLVYVLCCVEGGRAGVDDDTAEQQQLWYSMLCVGGGGGGERQVVVVLAAPPTHQHTLVHCCIVPQAQ